MIPRLTALIRDLHRRRVFRAGALYLVAAWVVLEVATTVLPLLPLPDWAPQLVLVLLALGFPVAIAVAWAFDLGPTGLERTAAPVDSPVRGAPTGDPTPHSIAVLPFVDLSRERDHEYLADGIADEILSVLSQAPGVRVAARTSAFAYKGRHVDVRDIGRQLGVSNVLEGSVRAAGDQLRVTAQLIGVGDGYQKWSRRFDRTLADVFAVQEEIAAEIATALGIRAPAAAGAVRPVTESLEAYEYYLRGRQYFHLKTLRSWRFAEQMFRRALQADPRYALAHAGHADTCAFLYMYYDASEAMRRCADESSLSALEYGPALAEAHVSRGLALSLTKRYAEAMTEFERALALNPRSFEARYFQARTAWVRGDPEWAVAYFRMAAEIQPESYETWGLMGGLLKGLGRTDEMVEAQRRAAQAAERVLAVTPDDVRALYFGAGSLLLLGERERALEWAERAVGTEPDDPGTQYNIACFFVHADMEERALDHLERAVDLGFAHYEWIVNDPDLARLKQHPRFVAALARIGDRARASA